MSQNELDDIARDMRALLEKAYQKGVADTRAAILSAVQGPVGQAAQPVARARTKPPSSGERQRAPRGLIRKVITQMLAERGPMSLQDIEAAIPDYDQEVSPKSAGTELRRGEEQGLYERDVAGWRLKVKSEADDLI